MKTFYLGILAILWLTGCAGSTHLLNKEGSAPFIGGELIHDRGESNRLVLEAQNRRYEARGFAVERQRGNDGIEVSCRFVWMSGAKPEGVCTDQAGTEFSVRFD